MSFINSALATLLTIWEKGKLVVLESTTYPGTTLEVLLPALATGDLELDRDFLLAFSPERVDPGNTQHQLSSIPKVVGGASKASTQAAVGLYSTIFSQVFPVGSPTTAELSKLLENTFRNVNIALVNEFAQICDALDVDVWEVINAAKTKPFGFMPFYPGPGIGGHCIPLDPQYLVFKSRLSGYEPRLVALADQINQERPRYVVQQAMDFLNKAAKPMKGAKILVLGVAYKPDVPDPRESPALPILEMLMAKGAVVSYIDPWIPSVALESGHKLSSGQDLEAESSAADVILIITAHKAFNYSHLRSCAGRVIDTRNALGSYSQSELKESPDGCGIGKQY
jgi:UDP-N-acetyl-D-glucosamine dehydrogenase